MANGYPTYGTVILGDLHGCLDLLQQALQALGLTDGDGHWCGGSRRLIQVGDVIDRGPQPLATLDFLMRLEGEAARAGGEVVCLMGNHELYPLLAAAGDQQARMSWLYNGCQSNYQEWLVRNGHEGQEQEAPYPEAFFAQFGPDQPYGRWIRSHPMACRAGDYVVVHGGWTPGGPASVEEANAAFSAAAVEPQAFLAARQPGGSLQACEELLWARRQPAEELREACRRLNCRGLIIGHTPVAGITVSCEGMLIQVDTGMYHTGVWTALGLDEQGRPWALGVGQEPVLLEGDCQVPLPVTASDGEVDYTPQHGPGSVIRLYRSADDTWRQYLAVRSMTTWHGYPAYVGTWLTLANGRWETREGQYPSPRVDEYGRLASADEIPSEVWRG